MCGPIKILRFKALLFSCLLVILYHTSVGQFSMNAYLSDARNDVRLYENKLKSEFLENNPYRSPVFHRVEFRTRSNNFDFTQDDFRFRLNPTNPFEMNANRKYYDLEANALMVDYQFALNKALHHRYNQIISYFQLEDKISFKEKEILVQRDQLKILESGLNDTNFEISEYIQEKENLVNLILELNELIHDREIVQHEIRSEFSYTGGIKSENHTFISNTKIKAIIELKSVVPDTVNNIHIENMNRQAMLDEQRIRVEKAEGRRNIGYFQAEYDRERGNEFDEHLGYQIGVRLPVTNPDRPDLSRRRLSLIEDKSDIVREKNALDIQCELLKMDLSYLFDQNDMITDVISNDKLLKLLNQNSNTRPEDLLEAQKSILKMKRFEKMLQWDIYQSFIDYLYYSGKLLDIPIKNYLSEDLDEI